MRTNGTLQILITKPGGVDDYGEPMAPAEVWTEPVACSITTNSDTRKGTYEDGEFRAASFLVLIEADSKLRFEAIRRVRLKRGPERLGEYRVISSEPLVTHGRIQILV